jgi:hypothetical protein
MLKLNNDKIINIFKLYFHYISIPFKILFIIICYFICYLLLVIISDINLNKHMFKNWQKLLMNVLSVNIICDNDNINLLNKYIYSDTKFISIYNHTNLIDPFLMFSLFENISVLLNPDIVTYIPFFDIIYKKFNFIYTKNGETTNKIIKYSKNRKAGENVLCIAPGEGKPSENPDENNITTFKSGAFIAMLPILPIIIKFEDSFVDYNFDKGEFLIQAILKIFLKQKHNVKVKVLDLVYPDKDESIDSYKNKVRDIMAKEYSLL